MNETTLLVPLLASADQFLVQLKGSFIDGLPDPLQLMAAVFLTIVPLTIGFALLFALTTWLERKGLGRIQNRRGPNRVGPVGLFQPIADGLKMLTKEDVVPVPADKVLHFLAPIVLLIPALLAFSVIPYGDGIVPIDLDAGILFFFAVGAATELVIFMAGWASRNKYALLGAMRAIAQMISYELPLILSTVGVLMIVGSLSLVDIVVAQSGWFFQWHVFTPWGFAGFLLFFVASLAEANRSPFDIPEGESEIIAGHLIEYSGFKYALFFMAEYLGLFAMSGLAITLFLGGYHAPFPGLEAFIPGPVWFLAKLLVMIAVFIWVRGTMPRLRMDQLMNFAWKFMLPLALFNLVVTGLWRFMPTGVVRWVLCAALLFGAYYVLGKTLFAGGDFSKRVYRYADQE